MASGNNLTISVAANTTAFTRSVSSALSSVSKGISIPVTLPLGRLTGDVKQFEKSLDAATARVISFTTATKILYGIGGALRRITTDAIQVEYAMARISSILKTTSEDTKKFKNDLFALSNSTSTAFYDVAEAAEEFSRQGLSVAKTLEATNAAIIAAKLSGTQLKSAIEGMTAVMSTFGNESLDFIDVVNKLSALDASYATSSGGLLEGLKRFGGIAADAKISLDEAASALTVLKQVTGRSEAVLGNSLKSIFTSLQTEKVQKDLRQIGVQVADSSGEFRSLIDVVTDLSKAFDSLNDSQKANITQSVAGKFQANAFSGLITAFKDKGEGKGSLFNQATQISKNSANDAEERIKKLNDTTEASLTRLKNTVIQYGSELGDSLTKPLIDKLLSTFDLIVSSSKENLGGVGKQIGSSILGGISNVLSGPGIVIALYTLSKFTKRIIADSIGAVTNILGVKKAQEGVVLATEQVAQFLPKIAEADLQRIGNLNTIAAKEREILKILNEQFQKYEQIQTGAAAVNAVVLGGIGISGNKIVKKAGGSTQAELSAMIQEGIDIANGVGGATPHAKPYVTRLNLGRGSEKVVVNSDEQIIKNYANSGKDAVFNREMMGYAVGSIPSLAIGKVYRGYDKTSLEGSLSRGVGSKVQKKFGYEGAEALKDLLRSRTTSQFLSNGPVTAYTYKNIPGATISSSSSPLPALRFVDVDKLQNGKAGLSEAGVRITTPAALERLKQKIKLPKGQHFGTYLYRLASKKPFGLRISDVENYRGEPNQFPIEQEVNLLDPKGKVFSPTNKLGFKDANTLTYRNLIRLTRFRSAVYTDLHHKREDTLFPTTENGLTKNGVPVASISDSYKASLLKRRGKLESILLNIAFGDASRKVYGPGRGDRDRFLKIASKNAIKDPLFQISGGYIPKIKRFAKGAKYPNIMGLYEKKTRFSGLGSINGGTSTRVGPIQFQGPQTSSTYGGTTVGNIQNGLLTNNQFRYPTTLGLKSNLGLYEKKTRFSGFGGTSTRVGPIQFQGPQTSSTYGGTTVGNIQNGLLTNNQFRIPQTVTSSGSQQNQTLLTNYQNGLSPGGQALLNQLNNPQQQPLSRLGRFKEATKAVSGKLAGAGFAASFVGGALAENFKGPNGESTKGSRLTSEISSSLGVAGVLASLNPVAGAIAAVGTSFKSLDSIGRENSVNLDELSKKYQEVSDASKNNSDAISNYANAFNGLNTAIASGDINKIGAFKRELGSILAGITNSELRKGLASSKNIDEIVGIGAKQSELDKRAESEAALGVTLGKNIKEGLSFGDSIKNLFTGSTEQPGRELLLAKYGDYRKYAKEAAGSVDINKLSDEAKAKILSGKIASASDLKGAVIGGSLLDQGIRDTNGPGFDKSSIRTSLSGELRRILESQSIAESLSKGAADSEVLKSVLRNTSGSLILGNNSKQTEFSGSFDKLRNKIELLGDSIGAVSKAVADYNVEVLSVKGRFAQGNNELNNNIISKTSELFAGANLTTESAAKGASILTDFNKSGDVSKFINDIEKNFGTGFAKDLKDLLNEDVLKRKDLLIEEKNALSVLGENIKATVSKIRAEQATKLYAGGEPDTFRSTLDSYKNNLGASLSAKAVNKNYLVTRTRGGAGPGFIDPTLAPSYYKNEVRVLDANAERAQSIIDKTRAEESLGLRGIDLSPNASPALVAAKKKEIERARSRVKEAFIDRQNAQSIRTVGETAPTFFDNINLLYKRGSGQNTPLLSQQFKTGFQYKVAGGDIEGALKSVQEQRRLAEAGGLSKVSGAGNIRDIFTQVEDLLTSTISNRKLADLAGTEFAKNEVKDKSLPQSLLDEFKKLSEIEAKSQNSLKSIESYLSGQNTGSAVLTAIGSRANNLGRVGEIDARLEDIRKNNVPTSIIDSKRKMLEEAITTAGTNYDQQLETRKKVSDYLYENRKVIPEAERRSRYDLESRRVENSYDQYVKSKKNLEDFNNEVKSYKRLPDSGLSEISRLERERKNLIDSSNTKYGEDLNNTIKPLLEELKPLFKSLEGLKGVIGTTNSNTKLALDVSVNGSDIIKSPEFRSAMKEFVEKEVYRQVLASNGVPPKLVPNREFA